MSIKNKVPFFLFDEANGDYTPRLGRLLLERALKPAPECHMTDEDIEFMAADHDWRDNIDVCERLNDLFALLDNNGVIDQDGDHWTFYMEGGLFLIPDGWIQDEDEGGFYMEKCQGCALRRQDACHLINNGEYESMLACEGL